MNELPEVASDKIAFFEDYCKTSTSFPIHIIRSLATSLRQSNLFKIAIKGSQSYRFDDTGVFQLVDALIKSNIYLVDLSLPYHRITDVGLEEISRIFKQVSDPEDHLSSHLEGLDLEGNEITGACFENAGFSSIYDCPLIFLNLSSNPLSTVGQAAIANIILKNKVLRQLSLNSCGFQLQSLIAISSTLLENSTLQLLYLDRPLLSTSKKDEVADHFSRVISKSNSLCDISMKFFNILDHGAKLLADALCLNESILSLNLECNNIGIAGAEHIASYLLLRRKNSLQSLGLAYNRIGDDGAIALAEVIRNSSSLRHLTLRNCGIGPVGLSAIAAALELATPESRLESLSLFGNDFDDDNGRQFLDLIQNKFPYSGLFIDIDVYVVDGKYLIAEN